MDKLQTQWASGSCWLCSGTLILIVWKPYVDNTANLPKISFASLCDLDEAGWDGRVQLQLPKAKQTHKMLAMPSVHFVGLWSRKENRERILNYALRVWVSTLP